jgi:osmotically-inducible protein OsmY
MSTMVANEHAVEHASEHLVQDLASDVEQAIWAVDRFRSTDSQVRVTATADGAVTLNGHVRGDMLMYLAGRIAAQVRGVTAVTNGLVADNELEADVAAALAQDPTVQAYTDHTVIKVILGVAQLSGTISGPDQAAADAALVAAEKRARSVPGVREVINNLRAVVGPAAAQAAASVAPAALADAGDAAAKMQARLAVWRERQGAAGA